MGKRTRGRNRIIAMILAVVLLVNPFFTGDFTVTSNLFSAKAALSGGENTVVRNRYYGGGSDGTGNLLAKGTRIKDFYGKENRTGIWYFRDSSGSPLACINPSKRQISGTKAKKYTISFADLASGKISPEEFGTISPLTLEQLETIYYAAQQLGLTPDKFAENGMGQARFIVYQSLVWAVVSGQWTTVDEFATQIDKVTQWVENPQISADIKTLVNSYAENVRGLTAPDALPSWGSRYKELALENPKQMHQEEDGTWSISLPIDGSKWEHRELVFGGEEENSGLPPGWSVVCADSQITFAYNGTEKPEGVVLCGKYKTGAAAEYMIAPTTIDIVIPDQAENQPMIGMAGNPKPWQVFVAFGSSPGPITLEPEIRVYRHEEVFQSDYTIQLEKRDHETGQGLEDAEFHIYEAFDSSQLDNTVLLKRNKEGEEGRGQFESPFELYKDTLTLVNEIHMHQKTGEDGSFVHSDRFRYRFARTYCGGHPEPQTISAGPDATPEEEEAAEEANQELIQAWEEGVQWCEENTDFHSLEPGEAKSACMDERDRAYEEFIHLKFQYAVREVKARQGYILHNYHNDDREIEIIETESSQAGGKKQVIGYLPADFDEADTLIFEAEQIALAEEENTENRKDKTGEEKAAVQVKESLTYYIQHRNPFLIPRKDRATKSEAEKRTATAAAAEKITPSDAFLQSRNWGNRFDVEENGTMTKGAFAAVQQGETDGGFQIMGPLESEIPEIDVSDYEKDRILHVFQVYDHRAEGELHINKRDMELHQENPNDSYGLSQGDGTLEGAVYGLYAGEDLVHPDGKTGVLFQAGELVSIASTDKNGDASFLAITEAPRNSPENFYMKGYREKQPDFDYLDLKEENGNQWIGRPLLLGRYYVKEIARSEGYELSQEGRNQELTNQGGICADITGPGAAETKGFYFDQNETSRHNKFDVTFRGTENGYDLYVSGYPDGTKFYQYVKTSTEENQQVIDRYEEKRTWKKAQGGEEKIDRYGNPLYVKDAQGNLVENRDNPQKITLSFGEWLNRPSYLPHQSVEIESLPSYSLLDYDGPVTEKNCEILRDLFNEMLEARGYRQHSQMGGKLEEEAGWEIIAFNGDTCEEAVQELAAWLDNHTFWNAAAAGEIFSLKGSWYCRLHLDVTFLSQAAGLRNPYDGILYVKERFTDENGNIRIHWQEYKEEEYREIFPSRTITIEKRKGIKESVPLTASVKDYETVLYHFLTQKYEKGEQLYYYFPDGEMVYDVEYIPVYKKVAVVNRHWTAEELTEVSRNDAGIYKIHVDNNVNWSETEKEQTYTFLAVTPADTIEYHGKTLDYGYYLTYVKGAAVYAVPSSCEKAGSYLKEGIIWYPGQLQAEADGNTREIPLLVEERPIKQSSKIVKTIDQESYGEDNFYGKLHEDWFTRRFAGFFDRDEAAEKMDNFRFKAYLKSNLERLYRDESGLVVWVDRKGKEVNAMEENSSFPGFVRKIYTKSPHKTEPLFQNSNEAVIANKTLYGYTNGLIDEDPKTGFTRILESGTSGRGYEYNYEKFFQALDTANQIKWDQKTGEKQEASPLVDQFAIDWYLEAEVEKLVQDTEAGEKEKQGQQSQYPDQVYDQAMKTALEKAENYLKPFFFYDLDEIYAVPWEREAYGGKDQDGTTLSVDNLFESQKGEGYYYGISDYLPYGTYIVVEQQPLEWVKGDFKNRHYRIDSPIEIQVPTISETFDVVQGLPGEKSSDYTFSRDMSPKEMEEVYGIRYGEEFHVIKAWGNQGAYEIYKYGLSLNHIKNGANSSGQGDYYALSQQPYNPEKSYYNEADDREKDKVIYYLSEGLSGREKVGEYYRYSSVSEISGQKNGISYTQGQLTALDGSYSPVLVPWTVKRADRGEKEEGFTGYVYADFSNDFYKARLRIEKTDKETGEPILYDGAVFALYAASREEEEEGRGSVKFYEKDTVVTGSREFLTAMGAMNITPYKRGSLAAGLLYTGIVTAGTPVCRESEQVFMYDSLGKRTGVFKAYTTSRDGLQAEEDNREVLSWQEQNTGYLETPQPLGAGVYVLCEVKPPAGYVRTKPIAIEVYSDKVSYYKDGSRDSKVRAAIYEDHSGKTTETEDTARIYAGNAPVRLEISKIKEESTRVVYKTDTRVEGTQEQLKQAYGLENLELAYKNGVYQGYGWYRGTIEYLEERKKAGEKVTPVYIDGIFAGYGLVERTLDTAFHKSPYVAGAVMALYEAIELTPTGFGQDLNYEGVEVQRDRNGNVKSIQVLEGFGGERWEFLNEENKDQPFAPGMGSWNLNILPRPDTDILFYPMDNLEVTEKDRDGRVYGYDRQGRRVQANNRDSLYVFRNGIPVYELAGGDLERIFYDQKEKRIVVPDSDTAVYHLDPKGIRDSLVDPETGMAYIEKEGRVYVWPVAISTTENGTVIAREKRITWRPASVKTTGETEYMVGSYNGSFLERRVNPVLNPYGLPVYYQKSELCYVKGQPIYDMDGDYVRYRFHPLLFAWNKNSYRINSRKELTDIGSPLDEKDDRKLYYRQGENWIIENRWISGESQPDNPFNTQTTVGQGDVLKRVTPGVYILEEEKAPAGYERGFPQAITVGEKAETQRAAMENKKIKIEISKTDAPAAYNRMIVSDMEEKQIGREPKGGYSYKPVAGAHLALFSAKRVYTDDTKRYPKGYFLIKEGEEPAQWQVENPEDNSLITMTAQWVTDEEAKYFEGIPAGDYILEELEAPAGFTGTTMEIEVKEMGEVQTYQMRNDHTKLEVVKYCKDEAGQIQNLPHGKNARLALYEAEMNENGEILTNQGVPLYDEEKLIDVWETDDLRDYTELYQIKGGVLDRIKSLLGFPGKMSSFITDFEAEYKKKGEDFTYLVWTTEEGERQAALISSERAGDSGCVVQMWLSDSGEQIRITIYPDGEKGNVDSHGQVPLTFEYQFNYRELENGVKSYDLMGGVHRLDYLPLNSGQKGNRIGNYVLVELQAPEGYEKSEPKAVYITDQGAVYRFGLENTEKEFYILKTVTDGEQEYSASGVAMALYRASENGELIQSDEYLHDSWISGEDGRYTVKEEEKGMIPDGFKPGDLRPHKISPVADQDYYLVELKVPDYMEKQEPVKLNPWSQSGKIYRFANCIKPGKLVVEKVGTDTGKGLANARFRLENLDTGQVWNFATDNTGQAVLDSLPAGKLTKEGRIIPYIYQLTETGAPELYTICSDKKRFCFDGSGDTREAEYICQIKNEPTNIFFTKLIFGTDFMAEGAELAVYSARIEDGSYTKGEDVIDVFTVGKDGFHMIKKLSAGRTYWLEERKVPPGLTKAEPVIFTVNSQGTGISRVSAEFGVVNFSYEKGAVSQLTVIGRTAERITLSIKNLDRDTVLPELTGTGTNLTLTEKNGIIDGDLYEITEYTWYSDGSKVKSGREVRRIYLDEAGKWTFPSRTAAETAMQLKDSEDHILEQWTPGINEIYTIANPAAEEPRPAEVTSDNGRDGKAVKRGQIIKYGITYKNTRSEPMDISITAKLSDNLEFIRATDHGIAKEKTVQWDLLQVAGGTQGQVEMVTAVGKAEGLWTEAEVTVGYAIEAEEKRETSVVKNPVASDGAVTIASFLTGLGKKDTDDITFFVAFRDPQGNKLTGRQVYEGTSSGWVEGEGKLSLKGDGFLTFRGLPYGTVCEIRCQNSGEYETDPMVYREIVNEQGVSAVFHSRKDNPAIRQIMSGGKNYSLEETVRYSDEQTDTAGIYRFKLNEDGSVDQVDMEDRPVELYFSKIDLAGEEELSGGHYSLILAQSGQIVYEFTKKENVPVRIPADLLEPGKEYIFREDQAPAGYHYEEDIVFTVDDSGMMERVTMEDKKTEVWLYKTDQETGTSLAGGRYVIKDMETGKTVLQFTSEKEGYQVTGVLEAGKTYEMVEELPPKGYSWSEPVAFTVPAFPEKIEVTMENIPTEVIIEKKAEIRQGEEKILEGAVIQILNEDKTPAKALREDERFVKGQELIFISQGKPTVFYGQLEAGKNYWMRELAPPDGYAFEKDIAFTVKKKEEATYVTMKDRPTQVTLSKKEITGSREIPGNAMAVKDKNGTVIDWWISGSEPHRIIAKLKAGETYRLCETWPAEGYALGEEVEFTVSKDGTPDYVEMINEKTRISIKKISSTGQFVQGALLQVLSEDKTQILFEFVSGAESWEAVGKLRAGEVYYLHEEKAPDGYQQAPDVMFQVPLRAEKLQVEMVNYKKTSEEPGRPNEPEKPETPKEPEIPQKAGYITASYERVLAEKAVRGEWTLGRKTGDDASAALSGAILLLCTAGLVFTGKRQRRSGRNGKDQ